MAIKLKSNRLTLTLDLSKKNTNVQFDFSRSNNIDAVTLPVPRGSVGEVVSEQGERKNNSLSYLVKFYYNPTNIPGQGHDVYVWVPIAFMGQYFDEPFLSRS